MRITRRFKSTPAFVAYCKDVEKRCGVLMNHMCPDQMVKNEALKSMWHSLPLSRRNTYAESAKVAAAFQDPSSFSTEEYIARILRKQKALSTYAGDGFVDRMAAAAAASLPSAQRRILQRLSREEKKRELQDAESLLRQTQTVRAQWKCMTHYNTFTDMLRVLTPTRRSLYFEVCETIAGAPLSRRGFLNASVRYERLSEDERKVVNPVSDKESSKFERFCCLNCGGMDPENLDIIALFAAFRRIKHLESTPERRGREELYKSFLSTDHIHDSDFLRARRAMARLSAQRSSDSGLYVFKRKRTVAFISPASYAIRPLREIDDVTVAEMLTSTRSGCSVYDDVLERADSLRLESNSRELTGYRVQKVLHQQVQELSRRSEEKRGQDPHLSKTVRKYVQRAIINAANRKKGRSRPPATLKHKSKLPENNQRTSMRRVGSSAHREQGIPPVRITFTSREEKSNRKMSLPRRSGKAPPVSSTSNVGIMRNPPTETGRRGFPRATATRKATA